MSLQTTESTQTHAFWGHVLEKYIFLDRPSILAKLDCFGLSLQVKSDTYEFLIRDQGNES